jgi:hypothetical protein
MMEAVGIILIWVVTSVAVGFYARRLGLRFMSGFFWVLHLFTSPCLSVSLRIRASAKRRTRSTTLEQDQIVVNTLARAWLDFQRRCASAHPSH